MRINDSLGRELIHVRRRGEGVAITTHVRPMVFRADPKNIRLSAISAENRCGEHQAGYEREQTGGNAGGWVH